MRALISRARAATSVRVSPSARNLRNASERCSALTNTHQLWSSHCSKRRSSQLVSSVRMRSIRTACSCGGMPSEVIDVEQEAAEDRQVLERLGQVGAGDDLVAPAGLREQDPRGAGEVVEHGARAVGDAPHGVRQVLVEAREEAEAVLGREVLAVAGARIRDGQAAGLAAGDVARLEHHDVEAAL